MKPSQKWLGAIGYAFVIWFGLIFVSSVIFAAVWPVQVPPEYLGKGPVGPEYYSYGDSLMKYVLVEIVFTPIFIIPFILVLLRAKNWYLFDRIDKRLG